MATWRGRKVGDRLFERWQDAMSAELLPGEEVLAVARCNNFRPMFDGLVVTSFRISGVPSSAPGIKVSVYFEDDPLVECDSKRAAVIVTRRGGAEGDNAAGDGPTIFKMVHVDDHEGIGNAVAAAQVTFVASELRDARERASAGRERLLAEQEAVRAQQELDRQSSREAAAAAREAEAAERSRARDDATLRRRQAAEDRAAERRRDAADREANRRRSAEEREVARRKAAETREERAAGERLAAAERQRAAEERRAIAAEEDAVHEEWAESLAAGRATGTQIAGRGVSRKAASAIARVCHDVDDRPWRVLSPGSGAGVLAAWDDRLAIIKTGGIFSFMAGSFGGERSATFHFGDITGIEYNSGISSGVLEVLTASYNGSANRDFWRGATKGRNADSNDPWTLSNTLPLYKSDYKVALPEIRKLRNKIASAKGRAPVDRSAQRSGSDDVASQLTELAGLYRSGALTDAEFAAAKGRILGAEDL